MNKKDNEQTGIKQGELPGILKDGKAFQVVSRVPDAEHGRYKVRYRLKLYKLMDDVLGDDAQSHATYKKWFANPERHVNGAFLERKFQDEKRWHKVVNAMYFAITEVLVDALSDARALAQFYADQDNKLSAVLANYEKQQEVLHG